MSKKTIDEIEIKHDTMAAIQALMALRIGNIALMVKKGAAPLDCLVADMVYLEVKIDALMKMCEEIFELDFCDLNHYLKESAKTLSAAAHQTREKLIQDPKQKNIIS